MNKNSCSPVDEVDVVGEQHAALCELLGSVVPVGGTLHSCRQAHVCIAGVEDEYQVTWRHLHDTWTGLISNWADL